MEQQVKETPQVQEQKAPTYEPAKHYKWEEDTKFELTGIQFGQLFNSIRAILEGPMAYASLLRLQDSFESVLRLKLKEAVESGNAKEFIPEQNNQTEEKK